MTPAQFSRQFDVLVDAFSAPVANGTAASQPNVFNEYEKSVFLTKAQEQICQELYTGYNAYRDSYEKTEELRKYLGNLTRTAVYEVPEDDEDEDEEEESSASSTGYISNLTPIDSRTFTFKLESDLWFITEENVEFRCDCDDCINGKRAVVEPATQDEFEKRRKNPFRGPNTSRVLRLDIADNTVELVSDYPIGTYTVRYMKKPQAIVLADFGDEADETGFTSGIQECELDSSIHQRILDRAVLLATRSRMSNSNNTN